jgi:hypothetical protein
MSSHGAPVESVAANNQTHFNFLSIKIQPKRENIHGLLIIIHHLHLGSTILKPELDLPSLQAQPSTKLQSLFLVRMRTFLKQTVKQTKATLSQYHSTNPVESAN